MYYAVSQMNVPTLPAAPLTKKMFQLGPCEAKNVSLAARREGRSVQWVIGPPAASGNLVVLAGRLSFGSSFLHHHEVPACHVPLPPPPSLAMLHEPHRGKGQPGNLLRKASGQFLTALESMSGGHIDFVAIVLSVNILS